jgi:hypothetical protein
MAARGNQSKHKAAPPFTVEFFAKRGYAVVSESGQVVSTCHHSQAQAQIACDGKIAAWQRAAKVTVRACMRCRSDFESEGIHNRMCSRCRHGASDAADPMGFSLGTLNGRRR